MKAILIHFIVGYAMAFLGLLSPGLLTMTTLNTAIERGKRKAFWFAVGAVLPIIIQAHLGLLGANYLKSHPEIIHSFSGVAVFVFFSLAIIFFRQYTRRHQPVRTTRFDIHNTLLLGIFVSTINPLAIPFYFSYSTLLEMQGILYLHQPNVSFFVAGAVLGALSIMSIYARYARLLLGRIQFIAKNFKLILAISMMILGLASLVNVLFN